MFIERQTLIRLMRTDAIVARQVRQIMSLELVDARRKIVMFGKRDNGSQTK